MTPQGCMRNYNLTFKRLTFCTLQNNGNIKNMELHQVLSTLLSSNKAFSLGIINEIIEHIEQVAKLRKPQIFAIKVYLYLRYELNIKSFEDLVLKLKKCRERERERDFRWLQNYNILNEVEKFETIKKNGRFKNDTLQEALNLDYPSFIFALTMGSGKTYLIASIIAIELAISIDTTLTKAPSFANEIKPIKNCLVFAPGNTILEQLKKVVFMDYSWVLPERLLKQFLSNVKFHTKSDFTTIGGNYNVIIINTESLIYTQRKKNKQGQLMEQEECNSRVQKVKTLEDLAIFSDEAHHVYGNNNDDIKKTRQVLNNIALKDNLRFVFNTTGTPFYKKQMLQEVVCWYGLKEAINDKILKNLENGFKIYNINNSEENCLKDAIIDFFSKYKDVKLKNGSVSKIAFYFKDEEHLQSSKIYIEQALHEIGLSTDIVIVNTQQSSKDEIAEFNNINDVYSAKRVLLLIKKGMEGFDCPSLFATAIIRGASTSSNYILQSSTRCLRNVYAENINATIYIDKDNEKILEKALQENEGVTISELNKQQTRKANPTTLTIKTPLPKSVKIQFPKTHIVQNRIDINAITLQLPDEELVDYVATKSLKENGAIDNIARFERELQNNGDISIIDASYEISEKYNFKYFDVYNKLFALYGDAKINRNHIPHLERQIEEHLITKEKTEATEERTVRLIKEEGFTKNEKGELFTVVNLNSTNENNLYYNEESKFHYNPYNFDSNAEKTFFETLLAQIPNVKNDEIEGIYFTGGLSHKQTDFYFEYQKDNSTKKYFPDFLIRTNSGKLIIVEIKGQNANEDEYKDTKRKADIVKNLKSLQDFTLEYHIIYDNQAQDLQEINKIINLINNA